ncbi:AMP-dependent synthetase/ligase [Pseudonocardia acidicola]|uniref:Acyl-CoA synthetase n=1 Tax=Pseudonocardia acidicola TaxID=2724939 RepID=A0ABX1SCK7_9PSEU|nr:AMP-dependent synthetase/ligase [Pseudonocardia acidicola]NMH98238.1 long-chain fatty acid--CoA ligase [Pseudonocardia acidicola]
MPTSNALTHPERSPDDTLLTALRRTVGEQGTGSALRWGSEADRHEMTWEQYARRAGRVAGGLAALGVGRGDHVLLLLRNRPEFYLADVACLLLGAIPVSVYLSPDVDALAHVLRDCSAVACIAENEADLVRAREALARPDTPAVRLIGVDDDTRQPRVIAFDTLDGPGVTLDDARARPHDTATMLYTSGTTGNPKGVPLTHANLTFAAWTLGERMGVSLAGRRQLSYLPMAHIGERLATHYLHMTQGSVVHCCPVFTAMPAVLAETSPHMLFGAPRMWERLYEGVQARLEREPALRDKAADPALRPAERRALLAGVFGEFGLAEIEVAIVGSAPLPRYVQQFWLDHDFPLADCYGQTETCGMGAWNPHEIVLGTCGTPFPGMEIGFTDDREILVRGPAVFGGYYGRPDATAAVLDAEGWYHTGDLGLLDEGGNLVLGGRMNDVIIPTSGHNVSPGALEERLNRIPLVGYAMVVGHGRPHLSAVLSLDPEAAAAWAAEHGRPGAGVAEIAALPEVRAEIDRAIDEINAALPGAERIRAHLVVGEPWPLASDLLTATGKMRRQGVGRRYADQIDQMYVKEQTR